MRALLTLVLLLPAIASFGQFDKLIKKGLEKGKKMATSNIDADRDKLDSTDFNYAMSVIDNSGMMDIRDTDETVTKTVYAASNTFLKEESDKTAAQKCRETLDMAERFYEIRQFMMAEVYFLDAKIKYEEASLTENINYSKVQADLGLLYATLGRFSSAEEFALKALESREKSPGKGSRAYASSLNNLGVLYQDQGRFNEAEQYFSQAAALVAKLLGAESQEYAIVLNNQAILFSKIGRYDEGIKNLLQAGVILDKLNRKNLRNQVGFQSNLALLYQRTGKLAEAEAIYLKLEKTLGANNPFYAGVLNNLALLYIQMNKLDKVEDYLKRAAGVYKLRFGDQNPNYAKVLGDLGSFYRTQGRLAESETNLLQSRDIRLSALGENHPDYVRSLEELALLYWVKADIAQANKFYDDAMGRSMDFINRYFPPMSENEKTKYWDVLQSRFQRYYNFCLARSASEPKALATIFNYQMATKGILLQSTSRVKRAILGSGNEELIRDYQRWVDSKETLARYYAMSRKDLQDQKIDLPALESEANNLEKSLSDRSKDFSEGFRADTTGLVQVAALLTETEAVVEIIRLRNFDKELTQQSKYVALIVTRAATIPKVVVLENGTELETRYAKFYKNAITQQIADEYSYPQYWSKIDPTLTGKKTIFLSSDGVYSQLNPATFKRKEGDYLANRYDFVTVGSPRDISSLKTRKSTRLKTAFVLGFPDYAGAATPLPGTKTEIEGISNILKTSGYKVEQRSQQQATESALKSIKGPGLLHVATHGYFLADPEGTTDGALAVDPESARNNPLLRSGLILAGTSELKKSENSAEFSSNDNGVLTAYEAMNLNLEGTELVVLSACETGLGEVKAGEGVYGLQRAFLSAGANAMIMSLWKVDDQATQLLMTSFYSNWVKGNSKAKAFKMAQQQLMLKYKEPYYWGAFVMMGM